MSVPRADVRKIREVANTPGGTTYFVVMKGKRDVTEQPLCFRPIHKDHSLRCTNPAGYGTWHAGTGSCKFHGGATKTNNIVTGREAHMTKLRLAEQIDKYLNSDRTKLLDLSYQLATTKAIFDEFMDEFPTPEADNYGTWFGRLNTILATMANLVDRISKMDARNTLTAAQVLYLRATVADILMRYIKNPDDRDRAARELASRVGGEDVEVEMRQSEFSTIIDIQR